MKLFARILISVISLIFYFTFVDSTFALTTSFRSASIITTDGNPAYTNLNNCSITDGQTCDRALAAAQANLYFRGFGSYADFGMSDGSIITKARIRVTGKTSWSYYVGLSLQVPATSNCQSPSDLLTGYLGNSSINVQNFTVDVTQLGIHGIYLSCLQSYNFESDRIAFRINYSSYPAWSANIDNFEIAFDYEPGSTPTPTPTPTSKTPLILIPGIGGSEFESNETFLSEIRGCGVSPVTFNYSAGDLVWIDPIRAGVSPCDEYLDVLKLKADEITPEYPQIVLNGNLLKDAYGKTVKFFEDSGYELNKTLFIFPYDWRKDISLTTPLLDQKIQQIKTQTGSQKVDILAHSMGGLVARNYISDFSKAQNVRKLFTLGTPHLGSVKSLKALRYGDCIAAELGPLCFSIAPLEIKDIVQNMISGYELAPSREYFNFYNGQDNNHLFPYQNNGQPLDYDQIKFFFTSLGYNTNLFNPSELFHALDNQLINTNGVEIINIAGSGLRTWGQIIEKEVRDLWDKIIQKKDGFSVNGDKTVPLFSASLIDYGNNKSLLGNAKVFYTRQDHGELVASGSALNLVKNILEENSYLPDGISVFPYSFSGTEFSVYSPVNVNIYDSFGNHTGPTINGDFEEHIPGSSYETLDDAKFIFLPDNGIYDIKFESTGEGNFDFKIRKYDQDAITNEILYKDIPLEETTSGETEFDTVSNTPPVLRIDKNGDEITDEEINESSNLTGEAIYDQIPPTTDFQISGILGENGWFRSDVNVTLNPQDESTGSGILKTEYSLDNGQTINVYNGPFVISDEKINKLKFRSVDNAGNEEDAKEIEIKIDKTAPAIEIAASPKLLWPANSKMIGVKITGRSFDKNPLSQQIRVNDEYHQIEPAISYFGQTIQLQAARRGDDKDGRKYTIKAVAEDLAGNTAQSLAEVIVPHDQRK